jgi:putative membrane protein
MKRFLVHWLTIAVALGATAHLLPGVQVDTFRTLLVAALVLGFVNACVRPILVILTMPITFLTLGLFYLVVNGAAFALAAAIVPGFSVATPGAAIGGALVVSLISWFIGLWTRSRPAEPKRP